MKKATVKNLDWNDHAARELKIIISAKDSEYIDEPHGLGFPQTRNSATLIEGVNYILEFGHNAISAMKGNNDFMALAETNRRLSHAIKDSELAARVRQLLSAIDYGTLTDFQAKCVLLVERELKQ